MLSKIKPRPNHWAKKKQYAKSFLASVWLFPTILTLLLILLTVFKINGSSMGTYHALFYGDTKDPNLIVGHPQSIRSDEWLVNTQLTIAQKDNDYDRINEHIGKGQDLSLLVDVPYKDWSVIFKPHNLAFFVMPFENAFAFRWWFMAYALILSCYLFVLSLLPRKRLLASTISVALFFSPFIQWWYLYGTLGVILSSLFGGVILIKLLNAKKLLGDLLWGALLAYVVVCFALILYPPFQIPCALVLSIFGVSYCWEKLRHKPKREAIQKLGAVFGSVAIASLIVFAFLNGRSDAVNAIKNTSYPGERIQQSGGYDVPHLLSGHLGAQLQSDSKSVHYFLPTKGLTNKSENSNFIMLFPFLTLPSFYILYRYYKRKLKIDWPLLSVNALLLLMLTWMFVPRLALIGKLTFLETVPHNRLIIGLGVLNLIQLVLFIRCYSNLGMLINRKLALLYASLALLAELAIGLYVMNRLPGFIDIYRTVAFALPIPLITYLLLRKSFNWAGVFLALFALMMTSRVNPLYQGSGILTQTPLSTTIRSIAAKDEGAWATEHLLLENFAAMNGARSLSGVYSYPQLDLWREADPSAESVYNRYAHTLFIFDRDSEKFVPTKIELGAGADTFGVFTEPCGGFLEKQGVRYLLTATQLNLEDKCVMLYETVSYPTQTFYIYNLKF